MEPLTTVPGQDMYYALLLCLREGCLDTGTRSGTGIASVCSWCPLILGHCGPIPGVKGSLEAGDAAWEPRSP